MRDSPSSPPPPPPPCSSPFLFCKVSHARTDRNRNDDRLVFFIISYFYFYLLKFLFFWKKYIFYYCYYFAGFFLFCFTVVVFIYLIEAIPRLRIYNALRTTRLFGWRREWRTLHSPLIAAVRGRARVCPCDDAQHAPSASKTFTKQNKNKKRKNCCSRKNKNQRANGRLWPMTAHNGRPSTGTTRIDNWNRWTRVVFHYDATTTATKCKFFSADRPRSLLHQPLRNCPVVKNSNFSYFI